MIMSFVEFLYHLGHSFFQAMSNSRRATLPAEIQALELRLTKYA